jgi:hypothetical protein
MLVPVKSEKRKKTPRKRTKNARNRHENTHSQRLKLLPSKHCTSSSCKGYKTFFFFVIDATNDTPQRPFNGTFIGLGPIGIALYNCT